MVVCLNAMTNDDNDDGKVYSFDYAYLEIYTNS